MREVDDKGVRVFLSVRSMRNRDERLMEVCPIEFCDDRRLLGIESYMAMNWINSYETDKSRHDLSVEFAFPCFLVETLKGLMGCQWSGSSESGE